MEGGREEGGRGWGLKEWERDEWEEEGGGRGGWEGRREGEGWDDVEEAEEESVEAVEVGDRVAMWRSALPWKGREEGGEAVDCICTGQREADDRLSSAPLTTEAMAAGDARTSRRRARQQQQSGGEERPVQQQLADGMSRWM